MGLVEDMAREAEERRTRSAMDVRAYRMMFDGDDGWRILANHLRQFVFSRMPYTTDAGQLCREAGSRDVVITYLEKMGMLSDENIIRIARFMLTLPVGEQEQDI